MLLLDKDLEKKRVARDILATRHLPKWFQYLENLNNQNVQSVYFVGRDLTIADLAIWRLLGWLTSGLLDGVPMNILEPYERLKLATRGKKITRDTYVEVLMALELPKEAMEQLENLTPQEYIGLADSLAELAQR